MPGATGRGRRVDAMPRVSSFSRNYNCLILLVLLFSFKSCLRLAGNVYVCLAQVTTKKEQEPHPRVLMQKQ